MPFELSWVQPKRVVMLTVTGKVDNKENDAMNKGLAEYIEQGQAPVHLIVELGKDVSVPMDISLLSKGSPIRSEKMGHAALIGGNGMLRFMAQMVAQLTKAKAHMVDTIDEALVILQEKDETLIH